MSHVYREGLKSARVFKRHHNVGTSPRTPVRDLTGQGSPEGGHPGQSDSDSMELAVPRRPSRTPPEEVESDRDSGVTTVLEALGEESLYCSSPDEEDGPAASGEDEEDRSEASEESDGDYATIPPQPVAQHQRPRRNRRPPVRFTPF